MTNPKSAANAWAKIKPKLFGNSASAPATPSNPATAKPAGTKTTTPRKPKANPQTVAKEEDESGESGETPDANGTEKMPKKTNSPRKRKPVADKEEGGSPKKKGRKTKKAVEAEAEAEANGKIYLPTVFNSRY